MALRYNETSEGYMKTKIILSVCTIILLVGCSSAKGIQITAPSHYRYVNGNNLDTLIYQFWTNGERTVQLTINVVKLPKKAFEASDSGAEAFFDRFMMNVEDYPLASTPQAMRAGPYQAVLFVYTDVVPVHYYTLLIDLKGDMDLWVSILGDPDDVDQALLDWEEAWHTIQLIY